MRQSSDAMSRMQALGGEAHETSSLLWDSSAWAGASTSEVQFVRRIRGGLVLPPCQAMRGEAHGRRLVLPDAVGTETDSTESRGG